MRTHPFFIVTLPDSLFLICYINCMIFIFLDFNLFIITVTISLLITIISLPIILDFGLYSLWVIKVNTFIFNRQLQLFDLVQPKMSPTLSLSGMYWKSFIYCRNRSNLRLRALIYFSVRSIWSYVHFKLGNSTIKYICDTQHLNIICIISYFGIFLYFKALLPLHHICYYFNQPTP